MHPLYLLHPSPFPCRHHKLEVEAARGHLVYKHVYVIDCSGLSMRLLGGSKRHAISNSLGKVSVLYHDTTLKMHTTTAHQHHTLQVSQYYPETMLKMFLVNTPRVFPMIWKVCGVCAMLVCSKVTLGLKASPG